jgi:hypothetical protein
MDSDDNPITELGEDLEYINNRNLISTVNMLTARSKFRP